MLLGEFIITNRLDYITLRDFHVNPAWYNNGKGIEIKFVSVA